MDLSQCNNPGISTVTGKLRKKYIFQSAGKLKISSFCAFQILKGGLSVRTSLATERFNMSIGFVIDIILFLQMHLAVNRE